MGFLHGKRALVTGVLSQRSIAWGIANAMHREGAQLPFTYVDAGYNIMGMSGIE
jgi:enoyl-[acyl-carrier protein] reductase I